MARLRIVTDGIETTQKPAITHFLAEHGIAFGTFEMGKRAREAAPSVTVGDDERQAILREHDFVAQNYATRVGYRADVVCFHPELPHLEVIVEKFGSVHFHFENEFWYFFDGEALFGFLGKDGTKFEVTVKAGEYLQVPEGCWQYFALTPRRRMKSMRFFNQEGRVPPRKPVVFV